MTKNRQAAAKLLRIAHHARNRPFQFKYRYFKTLLENGFRTRDPAERKYEIYTALEGIYNAATLGRHPPSQKIIAEIFAAGELVQKDLTIAYVFFRSAQKNGLDLDDRIEHIRPQLSREQISEAEDDIRQRNYIDKYDYRGTRKKLPQHP